MLIIDGETRCDIDGDVLMESSELFETLQEVDTYFKQYRNTKPRFLASIQTSYFLIYAIHRH